jgi:ATP-dependent DNA helicase RecG
MGSNAQMNRLLQGDVGSGKNHCSFYEYPYWLSIMGLAYLMAPTEILANQHLLDFQN